MQRHRNARVSNGNGERSEVRSAEYATATYSKASAQQSLVTQRLRHRQSKVGGCIYAQRQCGARQRQARRRHNIQTQALSVARRSIEWFWSASVKHSKSLSSAVKQRQSKAMGSEATSRNGKVTDSTGFFSNGESRIAQRALRRWHRIVTQGYSWRRHVSAGRGDG